MKKIAILTAALTLLASVAGAATIVGSKHDLSSTGGASASLKGTGDQICIYCHTPHNAVVNVPLWNRNTNPAGLALYNTSATLTNEVKNNAALTASSISSFCMSCHLSTAVMGDVKNVANQTAQLGNANTMGGAYADNTKANLGLDLTNDHPVGFNYDTAYTQDGGATGGLKALATATTNGAVFFGTGGNQMECASCHAVHNGGGAGYFLRTPNTGSGLCLACHNK
jgi:predicted CXXCH cytochrome family protein